jgi:hypothetical protein
MHDLFLISIPSVIYLAFIFRMHFEHKREIAVLYKETHEERNALLDRIMANNIHEYKAASGQSNVKRSESGNFLKDRMERSVKQYIEID